MENPSKTSARKNIERKKKSDDIISELPDSILHHILSLMPLQSSARTSILSRRWRDLWDNCYSSCIKTLDFGEEFARGQTPKEFVATVNQQIMQLHKGDCIRKFRLFFKSAHQYSSNVEKWIEFAAARGVIDLDLNFFPDSKFSTDFSLFLRIQPFKLPYSVFSCDSLIHLNLGHCDFNYPLDFNGFHALKTLNLRKVLITDMMLRSLVSNCPLLEELNLRECSSLNCINVSGPNTRLTRLTIVRCGSESIDLSAPHLQSFHYYGPLFSQHSFKNISSLVDVILNGNGCIDALPQPDCLRMLKDLMLVKILSLSSKYITRVEKFKYDIEALPITFFNLEELQLHSLSLCDEYLFYLYGFFQSCNFPFLERLFIDVRSKFFDYKFRYSPEEPIRRTFYRLKVIQISGFEGHIMEMQLVKFLLQKAIVLDALFLILPPNACFEKEINITNEDSTSRLKQHQILPLQFLSKQLASLPKASPNSRIVLCEYSDEENKLRPTHTDVYCGYEL